MKTSHKESILKMNNNNNQNKLKSGKNELVIIIMSFVRLLGTNKAFSSVLVMGPSPRAQLLRRPANVAASIYGTNRQTESHPAVCRHHTCPTVRTPGNQQGRELQGQNSWAERWCRWPGARLLLSTHTHTGQSPASVGADCRLLSLDDKWINANLISNLGATHAHKLNHHFPLRKISREKTLKKEKPALTYTMRSTD